ncbi:MAG TPA: carbohydrate ABC transporter permease [Acidimicrobiia bacterium]|nr:carbohydrate ABC transporter permease [Acidimicrobiia bacterium]
MRAVRILSKGMLVVYLGLTLVPFLFMITTAFKPGNLAQAIPPAWTFEPTLEYFRALLLGQSGASDFSRLLLNSVIVTFGATILTIVLATPAAYALSLQSFRSRKRVSMWILSTYMFPPIVAVIPVFILAGDLRLIDTYPVLIVPFAGFALPIAVWIIRGAILELPESIDEAARIDGANNWEIVRHVVLPLTAPAIATAAIITALLSWNEFLFALSLTRSTAKTAPVGVLEFTGLFGTQWGFLTAGSVLIVAPMLVITLILRRRLVEGLSFGAGK